MQNEGREERRRRITERECDRMAFITGRIHNLPPPTATSNGMDDSSDFHRSGMLIKQKRDEDSRRNSTIEDQEERDLFNNSTGIETTALGVRRTETRRSQPTLIFQQKASTTAKPSAKTIINRPKLFTSKRINSCVIDSQNSRVICSLIIAFLVVLSYVDYPLFGRNIVKSESVIASKPLYILLLTDVTIVLARMFLERRRDPSEGEEEEEGEVAQEDRQNWEAAVKLLERGLVIYQAFRGIFIDFSIYAVVVICGLSLVQSYYLEPSL